ncbi:MAG: GTP-binding protein [Clostridia bacterium]|nr:GTP-binding protein [Clostridia bacterium]
MTKLYMITGFLGSGKTTFLKKFATLFPDRRIALIINEFGKNGVDGALLAELGLKLAEIDNGSIFCSCRAEQFENAVTGLLENAAPDLIFVEASGLSDPTAVRDIFSRPIYGDMEYAGSICIVDAARFHKVYNTAKVCRMQLAVSDLVLINKTDIASREQIDGIKDIVKAQKPSRAVFETSFGEFKPEWLSALETPAGEAGGEGYHTRDIALKTLSLRTSGFTAERMESFLKMFSEETYRVKGFFEADGKVYAADCVGPLVKVSGFDGKAPNITTLTVLYGHGLSAKKAIEKAASWFEDCVCDIE